MSQKRAKEKRRKEKEEQGIPIAGCPRCQHGVWHIVLDDFPPKQRKIIAFACADRNHCGYIMELNIDLFEARNMEEIGEDDE